MAAIRVSDLTKTYGSIVANDGVTFDVEEGEIFGYLGPNGAGKTTTIRTVMGFQSPTSGTAHVLGADVTDRQALLDAKARIGYLPDSPQFDETATGRDILELHAAMKGDSRSESLLDLFDPPLDRKIREYSHGNVRKLGLVTTFMHDPDLVILDEPTSGLDPLMKQRFAEFVTEECRRGLTVFFSSHILGEVRRLCDRVGIIRDGRLVTVEPIESLMHRSGKVVRIRAIGDIDLSTQFDVDGVHEFDTSTTTTPDDRQVTDATLTFTGNMNELFESIQSVELLDCTIEEAPLEQVFLRFYGDQSVALAGDGLQSNSSTGDIDA